MYIDISKKIDSALRRICYHQKGVTDIHQNRDMFLSCIRNQASAVCYKYTSSGFMFKQVTKTTLTLPPYVSEFINSSKNAYKIGHDTNLLEFSIFHPVLSNYKFVYINKWYRKVYNFEEAMLFENLEQATKHIQAAKLTLDIITI